LAAKISHGIARLIVPTRFAPYKYGTIDLHDVTPVLIYAQLFGELPMQARIFQPARTAMSSGTAKTKHWVLEFTPDAAREVDPLMGWTSSSDTQSQVRLTFETKEAALEYAADNGIDASVTEPKKRRANIRAGGYGENFATNRRGAWTH
jgi:NADH dehydrogenase